MEINKNKKRLSKASVKSIETPNIDISKSLCEILSSNHKGFGFFLKYIIQEKYIYCLIANEHLITKDMINNNNKINILYDNETKKLEIALNEKERYINNFKDFNIDVSIIQILSSDNIDKDYFLVPKLTNIDYNNLKNNEISTLHYSSSTKKIEHINGLIKKVNKFEFSFKTNMGKVTSGFPIFLTDNKKVIGINKEKKKEHSSKYYADFIYPILDIIKIDIVNITESNKIIPKKDNNKIEYENGNYYIGEDINGIPNGKGILYYKNGNIAYEGNFINGKWEGQGKYIWENGNYYIGQFKNDLKHGKGIMYYKNGNIAYDGDFINGKFEGYGKYYWKDGDLYIGQFKNDLKHGKGIIYYKNGKIAYEGDFTNGKFEGNGKYIDENDNYYIGQFKEGKRHGKGIEYYKNGKIMYEGNFINNKREGY